MSSFAMCKSNTCELNSSCLRFTDQPQPNQAYIDYGIELCIPSNQRKWYEKDEKYTPEPVVEPVKENNQEGKEN